MDFSLTPKIFSLLLCSHIEVDRLTGGWQLAPLSHIAAERLPIPLNVVLCANIMAPAGEYQLNFRIFHAQDPKGVAIEAPSKIVVEPSKNVDYIARVTLTLSSAGLYMVEARLNNYDTSLTPLRVSLP
ncbi:MAG: hypothetical protein OHK0023_25470 [Anaerolineae bacterium]